MKLILVLTSLFLGMINLPTSAMNVEADPRIAISFMDKSLLPEVDILRVTTRISEDNNYLIFQIKTRGEPLHSRTDDYFLLQISHENNYALLVPINKNLEDAVLTYASPLQAESKITPEMSAEFKKIQFDKRSQFKKNFSRNRIFNSS